MNCLWSIHLLFRISHQDVDLVAKIFCYCNQCLVIVNRGSNNNNEILCNNFKRCFKFERKSSLLLIYFIRLRFHGHNINNFKTIIQLIFPSLSSFYSNYLLLILLYRKVITTPKRNISKS